MKGLFFLKGPSDSYGACIGCFFLKHYSRPDPHTSVPVPVLADGLVSFGKSLIIRTVLVSVAFLRPAHVPICTRLYLYWYLLTFLAIFQFLTVPDPVELFFSKPILDPVFIGPAVGTYVFF
jgi:hypothetical protein